MRLSLRLDIVDVRLRILRMLSIDKSGLGLGKVRFGLDVVLLKLAVSCNII